MYYKHGENNAAFYLCTSEDILLAVLKVFFFLCFFLVNFFPHCPGGKKACTQKIQWLKSSVQLLFFFFLKHNGSFFKESK